MKFDSSLDCNQESNLKSYDQFEKYDSKIFCRCCDANIQTNQNDKVKEDKLGGKGDVEENAKIDETRNANKDEIKDTKERSFVPEDQNNLKKIKCLQNSPTLSNYRGLAKRCSPRKEINSEINSISQTISKQISGKENFNSKKTSVPKNLHTLQKRNSIQDTCVANECQALKAGKIATENLQEEECNKNTFLQQSLRKAQELLFQSKLGIAIARRRGLNS